MENKILLNGTWETPSRNPLVAAFILVFAAGGIYFTAGSLVFTIAIYADIFVNRGQLPFSGDMDYLDMLSAFYSRYKIFSLLNTLVFQYLLFFLFPVIVIKKWHTPQFIQYFKYDRINWKGIALSVIGVFFIIPLVDAISRIFYVFFPIFEKLSEVSQPLLSTDTPLEFIIVFLTIAVTPAICEEAVFRGYFQRTLQRKLKFPFHFIVSGIVFALFHQSTFTLLALILVGIYLGFVYYCFSSIYVSMAVHFVYNFTLILLSNQTRLPEFLFSEKGYFRLPVVGVCAVLLGGLVWIIYKSRGNNEDSEPVSNDQPPDISQGDGQPPVVPQV